MHCCVAWVYAYHGGSNGKDSDKSMKVLLRLLSQPCRYICSFARAPSVAMAHCGSFLASFLARRRGARVSGFGMAGDFWVQVCAFQHNLQCFILDDGMTVGPVGAAAGGHSLRRSFFGSAGRSSRARR